MSRLLCPATRTTASRGTGRGPLGVSTRVWTTASSAPGTATRTLAAPSTRTAGTTCSRERGGGRSRVVTSARHDAVQPGVVQDRRDLSTGGDHVQDRDVLLAGDRVEQHHGATVRRHDHAPAVGRGHRPPGSEHLEVDRHGVRAGVGQHDPLTPAGLGPTGQEPGLGRRGTAGRRDQARGRRRHRSGTAGAPPRPGPGRPRRSRTADFAELT